VVFSLVDLCISSIKKAHIFTVFFCLFCWGCFVGEKKLPVSSFLDFVASSKEIVFTWSIGFVVEIWVGFLSSLFSFSFTFTFTDFKSFLVVQDRSL
jgi:hypothetical protein